ncbi:MAG: hypothetical protein ACRC57_11265 [Sarcina sp.]
MGFKVAQVSKELNLNSTAVQREVKKDIYKPYIYENNGDLYIKEDGIQKLVELIDSAEIEEEFTVFTSERENLLLRMEIITLRKELNFYKEQIYIKENKINELNLKLNELKIMEQRFSNVEEKVIANMRSNLISRKEKNKKKGWFNFK